MSFGVNGDQVNLEVYVDFTDQGKFEYANNNGVFAVFGKQVVELVAIVFNAIDWAFIIRKNLCPREGIKECIVYYLNNIDVLLMHYLSNKYPGLKIYDCNLDTLKSLESDIKQHNIQDPVLNHLITCAKYDAAYFKKILSSVIHHINVTLQKIPATKPNLLERIKKYLVKPEGNV